MKKSILILLVLVTGGFWGLSFVTMGHLMNRMDPMQVLSVRWALAAVIFLVMAAMGVIKIDLKHKAMKYLIIGAILQPCIYCVLEIYGIKYTSASVSSVIIATIPSMTLLVGMLFFRRRPARIGVIGIITAFAGVVISNVFAPGASTDSSIKGYVILFVAVATQGFYGFYTAKAAEGYGALERTAVMAVLGAITFNAACVFMGSGFEAYTLVFSDMKSILLIVFLGAVCTCVCCSSYNALLSSMEPATASNLVSCIATTVGVVSGILIAGDSHGWYTWVGLVVTLAGVVLSSRSIE